MPFSCTYVCKHHNECLCGCLNEARFRFDPPSREQLTKQKGGRDRQSSENTEHGDYNKAIFPFVIKSSYKDRAVDVHDVNTADPRDTISLLRLL